MFASGGLFLIFASLAEHDMTDQDGDDAASGEDSAEDVVDADFEEIPDNDGDSAQDADENAGEDADEAGEDQKKSA